MSKKINLVRVEVSAFNEFLSAYPRPLERDVVRFCDPPLIQYNDFTLGDWPHSVVASHSFDDLMATKPSGWMIAALQPEATAPAQSAEKEAPLRFVVRGRDLWLDFDGGGGALNLNAAAEYRGPIVRKKMRAAIEKHIAALAQQAGKERT